MEGCLPGGDERDQSLEDNSQWIVDACCEEFWQHLPMTGIVSTLLLAGALAAAQPPRSAGPESGVSARAVDVRVSLCKQDEDIGRFKFDLTVELRNEGSTPILLYRMLDQQATYVAIATSLENATRKEFVARDTASFFPGKDVVTQMTRESFVRLVPGQTNWIQVRMDAFVPLSPRPNQIRSGTYWVIMNVRTWPNDTTVQPETLNLGDPIAVEYLLLEPAEFSITVSPALEQCSQ